MATRDLVSDNKPVEQGKAHPKDNYERAATEAAKAGAITSTTASSAAAIAGKPEVQRQQSWKLGDLRAQQQGQMVEGKAGGTGYSSTGK